MDSQVPTSFDPQAFLDAQQSEVNKKRPPLPTENPARPDGLYVAVLGEPKPSSGTIGKGERIGQPWLMMAVPHQIEVPQQVQDGLGLKLEKGTMQLIDNAMIDLTPQGLIDNSVGRNRRQRQYRDALDLNKPGDVFSWRKVTGQPVLIKIEHEIYQGETVDRIGAIFKFKAA